MNTTWGAVYNFCAVGAKEAQTDWLNLTEAIQPILGAQNGLPQRKLLFPPHGHAEEISNLHHLPDGCSLALIYSQLSVHVEFENTVWNVWVSVVIAEVSITDDKCQEMLMNMWRCWKPFRIVTAGAGEELAFPSLDRELLSKFNPLDLPECDCAIIANSFKRDTALIHIPLDSTHAFARKRFHLKDAYGRH